MLWWDILALSLCVKGLIETCSLPLADYMEKGGQFQFLTNLTLLITTIFYGLLVISGIVNIPPKAKTWLKYYHRLCQNCEFAVTVAYWSLYFMFPKLLNIDTFDVSIVLDLEIHLFPYICLTISDMAQESTQLKHIYNYELILVYLMAYWTYIEIIYLGEAIFPYPFLSQEPLLVRLGWLLGFIVTSSFHNWIYDFLYI